MTANPLPVSADEFLDLVQDHLDGTANEKDLELLKSHERAWVAALLRLLDSTDMAIERADKKLKGAERSMVLADFESEYQRIDDVLTELVGPASQAPVAAETKQQAEGSAGPVAGAGLTQLQLSWSPGRVVAWAAGHDAESASEAELLERLKEAGAGTVGWETHTPVKVHGQGKADAVSAPIEASLGWLVALGATTGDDTTGPSVAWLGLVTALAVRLVAQGRVVPQLKKARRARNASAGNDKLSSFEVRWSPALVDQDEHNALSQAVPGAVGVLENRPDGRSMTTAVLTDLVTAICKEAASRLDVPAGPPEPTSKSDVAEAFLSRLDGQPFSAPSRLGSELSRRIDQWSRPIGGTKKFKLVIQLDPPDESNAWYLAVLAPNNDNRLLPVEQVIVNSSNTRRKEVEEELLRLERLYPELLRPGARRRGEVVLSQDEAWTLMSKEGPILVAAGYEVRAPALSTKKPTPSLRLTSEEAQESVVGAQQLANVRWSVVFDDIELTAEEIATLASEARPLVKSRGRWIELDQADLAEAAAALAERADTTRLSGADMLRHALGLEGSPLAGGISISGDGWAADLLRSAGELPENPPTTLEGFEGELRSYQADARTWLSFLDSAGLGGCLALDMGLGKTPTMLAHLQVNQGNGPALVIAPPAVVGNWFSEARKFVPNLRAVVHHGPNRATAAKIPALVRGADLIITTYGTAVRDMDALEGVEWDKVILDEAQAIKNPTSETAMQLRRLQARTRVALTGTPIENGLGDLWAIMDFTNPGLVGARAAFIAQLSQSGDSRDAGEQALRALNGILVFRRTKAEPQIAAELPDRIDELDHCAMTPEQIGLYQAVLDSLVIDTESGETAQRKGAVLAAITALKQICNHPAAYQADDEPLDGRSGKLARLNQIVDNVFAANERVLIFTHFASWGDKLADYLTERTGKTIKCYHGGLSRGARDRMVDEFQASTEAGAMVLSLKAGGTGLNLTAASHVVLYDRWWNPAVEDQARDRVWRIGQTSTVICHRLVCPGTVDERVEEVVAGKRQIADMVLPKSSSVGDLDAQQLQVALGLDPDLLIAEVDAEPEEETRPLTDDQDWEASKSESGDPSDKAAEAKEPETKEPETKEPEAKVAEAKEPEAKESEAKVAEAKEPEAKESEAMAAPVAAQ
ncbi:MAG: SNF2-related protein [Acidimicrobiales bacterium]